MNIPYPSYSKFVTACEEAVAAHGNQMSSGLEVYLGPGGYEHSVLVTISLENTAEFETDWQGSDPTRFPVRIRAAAAALLKHGMPGSFRISHQNGVLLIKRSENWSREELKASVEAYVDMLKKQHAGQTIVKKAYYEGLAQRFGRTPKAFEFRMQNISYVYSVLGREWLTGLKPAKHVGTQVAAQIESLIAEVEGRVLLPRVGFEAQVKELQQKPLAKPAGVKTPPSTVVSVSQYNRDPAVKAWVLKEANGHCECCGHPAPFVSVDGTPYLEVHHVRHLADGGSDTPENAVALCPNCHRAVHYASTSKELVASLYKRVPRLVKE